MGDGYFEWLKAQVDPFVGRGQHEFLFSTLHEVSFYALIPLDKNRASDGLVLREEYYGYVPPDPYFPNMHSVGNTFDTECSFFEFLIALSRKMNFIYAEIVEDRTIDLFWEVLANMGIDFDETIDMNWDYRTKDYILNCIHTVLERKFKRDGRGGLFPIENSSTDQRNQEIWYQMNSYIYEKKVREGRY